MSHGADSEALPKRLNERDSPKVPTEDIVQMPDFVCHLFLNLAFRSNGKNQRQLLGQNLALLHFRTPLFLLMILVQKFMLIKNYIKTWA